MLNSSLLNEGHRFYLTSSDFALPPLRSPSDLQSPHMGHIQTHPLQEHSLMGKLY